MVRGIAVLILLGYRVSPASLQTHEIYTQYTLPVYRNYAHMKVIFLNKLKAAAVRANFLACQLPVWGGN